MEAENFAGSSIVLAYLPLAAAQTDTISIMKNSKVAVDMYVAKFYLLLLTILRGIWPLYRWNPTLQQTGKAFSLESERIKAELKTFLDSDNQLSLIVDSTPHPSVPVGGTVDLDDRFDFVPNNYND